VKAITTAGGLLLEARRRSSLTQRQLADRAVTAQSVVARIERGLSTPTLGTLARLVGAAGYTLETTLVPKNPTDPVIEAFKRDIDRSLLRRNLEKTPSERVRSLQGLSRLAAEARRAGKAAARKNR